ncbi:hypothetical protein HA052_23195 [Chromobacterium haemolyticum]|uniref:Uncharacterized protein n=1 Tax=Chromobacterium fluminis TaxID=3044269 RepID=A0ABX0LAZ7_9NEIS|nr:hypothetical protein [Chromobacterium haemolyticum]NHR08101.1 hypothetical protein [Chromobacterium haemolyticum]
MELKFDVQQQLDQTALQMAVQVQNLKAASFQLEELINDIKSIPGATIDTVTTQLHGARQTTRSGTTDHISATTCAIVDGLNQSTLTTLASRRRLRTHRDPINQSIQITPENSDYYVFLRLDGVSP